MGEKILYIIRHGETEFNRQGIIQGSGVDSSLNNTGHEQARLFYEAYRHISFDKVYISALQRTRQSVHAFLEAGLPYEVKAELNEINWGNFEGQMSHYALHQQYLHMIERWRQGHYHETIPGGESPQQLQQRQKVALDGIMARPDEKQVLICMHGRAMKSFLCLLLQKELKHMEDFQHSNLCLYQLAYAEGKFSLLKANDTEHLQGNS